MSKCAAGDCSLIDKVSIKLNLVLTAMSLLCAISFWSNNNLLEVKEQIGSLNETQKQVSHLQDRQVSQEERCSETLERVAAVEVQVAKFIEDEKVKRRKY